MASDEEFVRGFDACFQALRRSGERETFERSFTATEVTRYIRTKVRQPVDFMYPYRDVLRGFPRSA